MAGQAEPCQLFSPIAMWKPAGLPAISLLFPARTRRVFNQLLPRCSIIVFTKPFCAIRAPFRNRAGSTSFYC